MREAPRTSETFENSSPTTRCYNPEDSNLLNFGYLKDSSSASTFLRMLLVQEGEWQKWDGPDNIQSIIIAGAGKY
jgi:hypothetical protein